MQVAENERGQQTVNMMGASTSECEQNMIHYDPRNFLQLFMQQPQYYSQQQEDRKAFKSGKIILSPIYVCICILIHLSYFGMHVNPCEYHIKLPLKKSKEEG